MVVDTLNPIRILKPYIKRFWNLYKGLGNRGGDDETFTQAQVDEKVNTAVAAAATYVVPDDIKEDPIFEKYKTQEARDRALLDAQKFLGREKLPVPSGPEDKTAFDLLFKTIGRPDTVEGYKTPDDIQFEEGFPTVDEELVKTIKQTMLDNGVSSSQFDKIYRTFMGYSNTQFKNAKTKVTADREMAEADLRKELGAAYPQTVALAEKVVLKFADEAAWNTLDGGLGNNPVMIKMLSNIGKLLSEHQLVGEPAGLSFTPEAAQAELNKMMADLKGPLHDAQHPLHKEMVEKKDQLTRLTLVGK